jgi:alpha-galactosidase
VTGKDETIAALFHRLIHAGPGYEWLYVSGLDSKAVYSMQSRQQALRVGQFGALVKHITPIELNPNGMVLHAADKYYRMHDATEETVCSGAALQAGIPLAPRFTGTGYREDIRVQGDFLSNVYLITKESKAQDDPV